MKSRSAGSRTKCNVEQRTFFITSIPVSGTYNINTLMFSVTRVGKIVIFYAYR